jgi:hypothetical protein
MQVAVTKNGEKGQHLTSEIGFSKMNTELSLESLMWF